MKSIRFKESAQVLEANAFANTKALTLLDVGWMDIETKYTKSGKLKSLKFYKDTSYKCSKKAFAKCGKKGGKALTLKCNNLGRSVRLDSKGKEVISYPEAAKYKAFFVKYGLPKKAKVIGS